MISQERFKEFEQFYLFEVIKNPDYRYGQAFLNYFHDEEEMMMTFNTLQLDSTFNLWEERDLIKARRMCLKYVEPL
jgi:hypothetical protein